MKRFFANAYYFAWQYIYARNTKNIEGFLTIKEGKKLYGLAKSLEANSLILEIGSFKGRSANFLLQGMKSTSKLYCVDTWLEPVAGQVSTDNFHTFKKNTKYFERSIVVLRGRSNSKEVLERIPQGIDLLFVDAGHAFDEVFNDLMNYLPKVNQNGIVAMHDYFNPCGVKSATDLFLENAELHFIERVGSMAICAKI